MVERFKNVFTADDGYVYKLGNRLPELGKLKAEWPLYGSVPSAPLIPRGDWPKYAAKAFTPNPHLPSVHDQNGYGMCNASATCAAMEYCRAVQGLKFVKLSAGHLYGRINGGRDQGSLLEDGLEAAMKVGVATVGACPYLQWRSRPPGSDEQARHFRVLESFLCPTFDHVFSAVCMGFGMITGIRWYDNFTPNEQGWLPRAGRGRWGGHAIFGHTPVVDESDPGHFGVEHTNSWTERYGKQGRFVIGEEHYSGPVGGWWAVRAVTDEGGGELPEPKDLE
jgi:hypothetical protein